MAQIHLSETTIDRLEALTGKNFTRGADKMINQVIDVAEGTDSDTQPRAVLACGFMDVMKDEKE